MRLAHSSFPAGYFTGETASWHTAGVILSEVRHSVAKAVPRHAHDAPYFSLLLEGSYSERGESFDLLYEPYTLVFHSAHTVHEDEMSGPSRFFAVELLKRWDAVITELGGARAHVFELNGGDPVWLVLRLYREFVSRPREGEGAVESLLYELCAHVAARSTEEDREPEWLAQIDARVGESFQDPLDLIVLASNAGVHAAHLCRTYRRFRGRTINDAIVGMRVQHVCRRLVESNDPLAEIAVDAGFTDQSHMTRVFKRLTGYSPGAHRRRERA